MRNLLCDSVCELVSVQARAMSAFMARAKVRDSLIQLACRLVGQGFARPRDQIQCVMGRSRGVDAWMRAWMDACVDKFMEPCVNA